jgi:hypothetical protein
MWIEMIGSLGCCIEVVRKTCPIANQTQLSHAYVYKKTRH